MEVHFNLVTSIIVNPEGYKSPLVCDLILFLLFLWNGKKLLWVIWSSDQACTVDALAVRGDEGRGNLRKGSGS